MRRISANYIFPADRAPIRNGIIETEDDGTIRRVYDFGGEMKELAHTEFLNGVLVPGFINMHTHLEFSWHTRKSEAGKGMHEFINQIISSKKPTNYQEEIQAADDFMYRNGTIAACDIINTDVTINIKKKSPILYHNFIEAIGFLSSEAEINIKQAKNLLSTFKNKGLSASLAPHAPYSISTELWKKLEAELQANEFTSMHNMESFEETEMFTKGSGKLIEYFQKLGVIESDWQPTGLSPIQSVLKYLKETHLLLVHNTFVTKKDIEFIKKQRKQPTAWVLCPTSNQYITGQLPDIEILEKSRIPITIGTDSTASGQSLSLLDELKVLQKGTKYTFATLLEWTTKNAAQFMRWKHLGTIAPGKKPGLNLISKFDFDNMKLKPESRIKRII